MATSDGRVGRFLLSSNTPTQELQPRFDAIDARNPPGPFQDPANRFLVSTLPVEAAFKVADGIEVIARTKVVNVRDAIQRVVSLQWVPSIHCMRKSNGMGGPDPPEEALQAVLAGEANPTFAEQLREWFLAAHTFLQHQQESVQRLDGNEYWTPVTNLLQGRHTEVYGEPPTEDGWQYNTAEWRKDKASKLRRDKAGDVYEGLFHRVSDPTWDQEAASGDHSMDRHALPLPVLTGATAGGPAAYVKLDLAIIKAADPE